MLQEVDNQVHIEMRLIDSVSSHHALLLHLIFPRFVFFLDQVDSVANDSCLDDPFDNCKGSETLITARFHQETIAEEIVEEIEYNIATCQTINLATESQIDQQVIVEEVPNGQKQSYRDEYDALNVFIILIFLQRNLVNEPGPSTDHQYCPSKDKQKLRELNEVKEPKCRLPHFSLCIIIVFIET